MVLMTVLCSDRVCISAVVSRGGQFKALTSYTATSDDELSYKQGDVIEVIERSLDGWWTAR